MNDVAAQKIMNYIDKYLFEPQCDWDKQIFKERSYSRWAAFYILEQMMSNPFIAPDDIIEDLIIKWTLFSCINEDTEANTVFTIASDTAEELLKIIEKEKEI